MINIDAPAAIRNTRPTLPMISTPLSHDIARSDRNMVDLAQAACASSRTAPTNLGYFIADLQSPLYPSLTTKLPPRGNDYRGLVLNQRCISAAVIVFGLSAVVFGQTSQLNCT